MFCVCQQNQVRQKLFFGLIELINKLRLDSDFVPKESDDFYN